MQCGMAPKVGAPKGGATKKDSPLMTAYDKAAKAVRDWEQAPRTGMTVQAAKKRTMNLKWQLNMAKEALEKAEGADAVEARRQMQLGGRIATAVGMSGVRKVRSAQVGGAPIVRPASAKPKPKPISENAPKVQPVEEPVVVSRPLVNEKPPVPETPNDVPIVEYTGFGVGATKPVDVKVSLKSLKKSLSKRRTPYDAYQEIMDKEAERRLPRSRRYEIPKRRPRETDYVLETHPNDTTNNHFWNLSDEEEQLHAAHSNPLPDNHLENVTESVLPPIRANPSPSQRLRHEMPTTLPSLSFDPWPVRRPRQTAVTRLPRLLADPLPSQRLRHTTKTLLPILSPDARPVRRPRQTAVTRLPRLLADPLPSQRLRHTTTTLLPNVSPDAWPVRRPRQTAVTRLPRLLADPLPSQRLRHTTKALLPIVSPDAWPVKRNRQTASTVLPHIEADSSPSRRLRHAIPTALPIVSPDAWPIKRPRKDIAKFSSIHSIDQPSTLPRMMPKNIPLPEVPNISQPNRRVRGRPPPETDTILPNISRGFNERPAVQMSTNDARDQLFGLTVAARSRANSPKLPNISSANHPNERLPRTRGQNLERINESPKSTYETGDQLLELPNAQIPTRKVRKTVETSTHPSQKNGRDGGWFFSGMFKKREKQKVAPPAASAPVVTALDDAKQKDKGDGGFFRGLFGKRTKQSGTATGAPGVQVDASQQDLIREQERAQKLIRGQAAWQRAQDRRKEKERRRESNQEEKLIRGEAAWHRAQDRQKLRDRKRESEQDRKLANERAAWQQAQYEQKLRDRKRFQRVSGWTTSSEDDRSTRSRHEKSQQSGWTPFSPTDKRSLRYGLPVRNQRTESARPHDNASILAEARRDFIRRSQESHPAPVLLRPTMHETEQAAARHALIEYLPTNVQRPSTIHSLYRPAIIEHRSELPKRPEIIARSGETSPLGTGTARRTQNAVAVAHLDNRQMALVPARLQEKKIARLDNRQKALVPARRQENALPRLDDRQMALVPARRQENALPRLDIRQKAIVPARRQENALPRLDNRQKALVLARRQENAIARLDNRQKAQSQKINVTQEANVQSYIAQLADLQKALIPVKRAQLRALDALIYRFT